MLSHNGMPPTNTDKKIYCILGIASPRIGSSIATDLEGAKQLKDERHLMLRYEAKRIRLYYKLTKFYSFGNGILEWTLQTKLDYKNRDLKRNFAYVN